MSTMNISLPETLKSFVDEQVSSRGFGTSSEYVRELIRKDQERLHLRELLLAGVSRWRQALRRSVLQAQEAGHLRADADLEQLVFELDGLFTALVREARFLRNPEAESRGWASYQRLIQHYKA